MYETFDQQLLQDLISGATETRNSAEGLFHCVKVMKNLKKNERSDNKTKRYAKAQAERFGSAEFAEIRALIQEATFMQSGKLLCFS